MLHIPVMLVLLSCKNFFIYFLIFCTPGEEIYKQLIKDLLKGSAFCRYASWTELFENRSRNASIRGDDLKAKVISGPIWGLWLKSFYLPLHEAALTALSAKHDDTKELSLHKRPGKFFTSFLCTGLPSEVSGSAVWSYSEAGLSDEEVWTSGGWVQTLLGSPQNGKKGTHTQTHTVGRWGRLTETVMAGLKRISNDEYEELCVYLLKGSKSHAVYFYTLPPNVTFKSNPALLRGNLQICVLLSVPKTLFGVLAQLQVSRTSSAVVCLSKPHRFPCSRLCCLCCSSCSFLIGCRLKCRVQCAPGSTTGSYESDLGGRTFLCHNCAEIDGVFISVYLCVSVLAWLYLHCDKRAASGITSDAYGVRIIRRLYVTHIHILSKAWFSFLWLCVCWEEEAFSRQTALWRPNAFYRDQNLLPTGTVSDFVWGVSLGLSCELTC